MRILNVAYPFAPVGPDAVGGAEQVLTMIDQGLVAGGEESVVLGANGSITAGPLVEFRAPVNIDDGVRKRAYRDYAHLIAETITDRRIDLVHMHGVDFAQYIPATAVPLLVTLHLPLDYYQESAFVGGPHTFFNAVSEWQQRHLPVNLKVEVVRNGVDTQSLRPAAARENFVLVLGRVCPEKGFHFAMQAAASAGVTCVVAGRVYGYPEHQDYFNREIVPRLDSRRRFVGPVGGTLKRHLLAAAKCVLIPSLVAETSSLVGMEALACGTPVIAFRSGALVEIVSHERTGFLVDDMEEMAQAIALVDRIDPRECRAEACRRFSAIEMTSKYLHLYRAIIRSCE